MTEWLLRGLKILALVLVAGTVSAQETTDGAVVLNSSDLATPETIDALVAKLSDSDVRALLLDYLKSNVDEVALDERVEPTLLERIELYWDAFKLPTVRAVTTLPTLAASQSQIVANFFERQGGVAGIASLFLRMAAILALALAAEWLVRRNRTKRRPLPATLGEGGLIETLKLLWRRLVREFLGLFVFFVTIRITEGFLLADHQRPFAEAFILCFVWLPRLGAALSRFLITPDRPHLRMVHLSDRWARFLHRHIVGLILLGGLTIFIAGFNERNGLAGGQNGIAFWLDSLVYVYLIYIIWVARDALRGMMLDGRYERTRADVLVAQYYPIFAIAVAVATWILVSTLIGLNNIGRLLHGAHYITMFALLAAPLVDVAVRAIVDSLVAPLKGEGAAAASAYHATKRSYIRIGRVIVAGVVLFTIAQAWDIELVAMVEDQAGIGDNIFAFCLTLAVGYFVFESVSLWINKLIAAEDTTGVHQDGAEGAEQGGPGGSRLSTVLPLLLMMARGAIIVIFGLLAIGNLGINITPLLAGAGVLGLAIGFGAQKLVADVVSGIFFLIDDAFRIGEYVDIGSIMGNVEKISLRSMQLRHHRGHLHTIPYGEIQTLTNFSRDWAIMKLRFTVPFETDPNLIKRIFKRIGQEMMEVPEYAEDFLEPFKSQGVADFDEVGMVVRGKFMAKPGRQFVLRKEIYNRVHAAFAENGIPFAKRQMLMTTADQSKSQDHGEAQHP